MTSDRRAGGPIKDILSLARHLNRRLRPPLARQPLHPLHRRHDGDVQGRRVAPRGRLLCARWRTDPVTNVRVTDPPRWRQGRRRRPRASPGGAAHARRHAVVRHGAGFVGAKIVLMAKFDPHEVWRLVGDEKVNSVMITGDAMGSPDRVARRRGTTTTCPRCWPWCRPPRCSLRRQGPVLRAPPQPRDHGRHRVFRRRQQRPDGGHGGQTAMKSGPTVHLLGETVVFDEDLDPVEPGSGVIGKIARAGDIPLGYYNDPKKTAEVFIQVPAPASSCRVTTPPSKPTDRSPARSRVHRHQLRRREDLSRGGRVRRTFAPRRHGRDCVRGTRRALGTDGGGHHRAAAGTRGAVPRGHAGAVPGVRGRLQGAPPPPRRRRGGAFAVGEARLHMGRQHRERRGGVRLLDSRRGMPGGLPASTGVLGTPGCATVNARPTAIDAPRAHVTLTPFPRFCMPFAAAGWLVHAPPLAHGDRGLCAGLVLLLSSTALAAPVGIAGAAGATAHVDASTSWTVYHGNPLGSGDDTSGVSFSSATQAWSSPVLDGQVYGEPLEATGRRLRRDRERHHLHAGRQYRRRPVVEPRRDTGPVR